MEHRLERHQWCQPCALLQVTGTIPARLYSKAELTDLGNYKAAAFWDTRSMSGPWNSLSLCLLCGGQQTSDSSQLHQEDRDAFLQQCTKTQYRVSLLPLQLVTVLSLNQSLALRNAAVWLDGLGLATVEAQ